MVTRIGAIARSAKYYTHSHIRENGARPRPEGVTPRCVVVAGGGTAGHVYPGLAIADAYARSCDAVKLLFIGTPQGLESRLVPQSGHSLRLVQGGPLFGVGVGGKLLTLWRSGIGMMQARRLLRASGTNLVIGVGGYASAAAILAARSLGLGTAIHEANTVPGLANALLGRVVDRIYLGSAAAYRAFPKGRTLVTGNPVRSEIVKVGNEERRAPQDAGRPARVLITGGSLGSPFLNRRVPELLAQTARRGLGLEVLHQVGEFAAEPVCTAYTKAGLAARVTPYIEDMASAYRWADCAIARAGAGTIAELAVCGIPALLVPLPHAPGNHQIINARAFAESGAGWWVRETDWEPAALAQQLVNLLSDAGSWTTASRGARRLGAPEAADAIVVDCEAMMAGRW